RAILHGTGDTWIELGETKPARKAASGPRPPRFQYKGLFPAIDEASRISPAYRQRLDHLVSEVPCSTCHGSRLRDDAAAVRFQGRTIGPVCGWPLGQTLAFFQGLKLSKAQQQVAGGVFRGIRNRPQFLVDGGL